MGNFLLASSWEGTCTLWEFEDANYSRHRDPRTFPDQGNSVLRCTFGSDSNTFYFGNTKGEIKSISQGGQNVSVGKHDQPIVGLKWCSAHNCLISCGMEGNTRFWDLRSKGSIATNNPDAEIQGNLSIVNCDTIDEIIYIATVGQKIRRIDLRNASYSDDTKSELDNAITSIACLSKGIGYVAGSISGQVEVYDVDGSHHGHLYFHPSSEKRRRDQRGMLTIAASNSVAVSHAAPAGVSVGSDGTIGCFNPDICKEGAELPPSGSLFPYTACAFSQRDVYLAYAKGYDWSQGADYFDKNDNLI